MSELQVGRAADWRKDASVYRLVQVTQQQEETKGAKSRAPTSAANASRAHDKDVSERGSSLVGRTSQVLGSRKRAR